MRHMKHGEALAKLRAEVAEQMTPLGQRRIQLLAELEDVEKELKPLVAEAVDLEIPYRKIYAVTGVAPNTSRDWWKKANTTAA